VHLVGIYIVQYVDCVQGQVTICTVCSGTSYKIVPLINLNRYLHYIDIYGYGMNYTVMKRV